MKVVTVIGARPQFIKAAVISRAFQKSSQVEEVIVHTGQHFDTNMSDVFFEEMSIPKPKYNLNINGLGHGAMTGQMLEKIEEVLLEEKPDWVLVYGDTNSTLAGAIAATKLHIKVAHVEAGLRSFNMKMPEEVNRILTDRVSNVLFCPTDQAVENLLKEGYANIDTDIVNIGDVMQDAAIFYSSKAKIGNIEIPSDYILCTIHRAENTNDPQRLNSIIDALNKISQNTDIVLPLHPRTRLKLDAIGFSFETSKIKFIEPVGYLEMVYLLKNCSLVMTDSGGLQKEAYFFSKYCITLRDETEWVELVNNGYNSLVGSDYSKIINEVESQLKSGDLEKSDYLYGRGDAGEKMLEKLLEFNS